MQTEQAKNEAPVVDGLSRKDELLAKKADRERKFSKLSSDEQEELDALLEEEKLEKEHGALVHKLTEAADTYGRKTVARIRREVTDKVAAFSAEEKLELGGIHRKYANKRSNAEREMRKAMKKIQEEHARNLGDLDAQQDKETEAVKHKYSGQYRAASAELKERVDEVTHKVAAFSEDIPHISLEKLRELEKNGTVTCDEDGSISVPGRADPS